MPLTSFGSKLTLEVALIGPINLDAILRVWNWLKAYTSLGITAKRLTEETSVDRFDLFPRQGLVLFCFFISRPWTTPLLRLPPTSGFFPNSYFSHFIVSEFLSRLLWEKATISRKKIPIVAAFVLPMTTVAESPPWKMLEQKSSNKKIDLS